MYNLVKVLFGGIPMQQTNSIIAVFEAIAAAGEASRATLSEMTGFSLMTVGKAVDKLIDSGIVTEKKLTGGGVGRKSGICALEKSRGMILFDLTDTPRVRVCDIASSIIGEREGDDTGEMMLWAMNTLFEAGIGEIMGTAVVFSRENKKTADELENMLGVAPELAVEANRAAAYANSKRFEHEGAAFFMRVDRGAKIDGAVMLGKQPYHGAHGRAGEFGKLGLTVGAFADKLADLCLVSDPELIHIACENQSVAEPLTEALLEALEERGFTDGSRAEIVVEYGDACRGALDGAALMLREKYVFSKIPNNT